MSEKSNAIYEFGEFRLDAREGTLSRDGVPVSLTPKAFATLLYLVEHSGRLVEKTEMIDQIWDGTFVEESAVSWCIWSIRNALGDDSKAQTIIKTVPKRGYRFIADVRIVERGNDGAYDEQGLSAEASGVDESPNVTGLDPRELVGINPAVSPRNQLRYVFVSVLVILGLFLVISVTYRQSAGPIVNKQLAVLPLKPINPEQREPIAEFAIAESLIAQLSKSSSLSLRPLTAVRNFVGLDSDPIEVGRELRVDYILSSNYQISDGMIRVTSQLFRVADGANEGSFKAEASVSNAFEMQDSIANSIGNELASRLGESEQRFVATRDTNSEEAYRTFQQAMYLVEKNETSETKRSIELFDQAIELDPTYSAAWAGKARAHCAFSHVGDRSPEEEYKIAGPAVVRALELNPNSAEALAVNGIIKADFRRNFRDAEKDFQRAIELAPTANYYRWYGSRLVLFGDQNQAIASVKAAVDNSPADIVNHRTLGSTLYLARRYEESIRQLERTIEMDPTFATVYHDLWLSYYAVGDKQKTFENLVKFHEVGKTGPDCVSRLTESYQKGGLEAALRTQQDLLMELENIRQNDYWPLYYRLAVVSALVGDKESAFAALEKAFRQRSSSIAQLKVDPGLDPLRDDPRFYSMLKRVGF